MTYALLCALFLGLAVVAALALSASRPGGARRPAPVPLALAAGALVLLTAAFDNLMIAAGLFAYADEHVSGLRIGLAPVEDFAYPLAVVVLLPALWSFLGRRRDR
ncbi:lycopene cyclase domain-containing protein [Microbacterium betulae]|uniref:Lycopene cyclase domain-containing protein n=1 Tax=Microbacterium betulae TaxID=2981139 RepID=A0AA97I5C5_9MICO|nr:lycopene cyclase domain-containing protein [Microbacterium sp. AB]WOF22664.1 lycopene cyclase domain-containing protein [Microbacterium sp. AB]